MKKVLFFGALTLALLGVAVAGSARADSGSANYQYLISTSFLCGINPAGCPATAAASNGDTIGITGGGTLSIHSKSVTGSGTFAHKNAAGTLLASGTWSADQLLSFNSYGPAAPSAGFPSSFEGGQVLIAVTLDPGAPGGPTVDAVLEMVCRLPGDNGPSEEGKTESVRLNVKGGPNFNEPIEAVDIFIKL